MPESNLIEADTRMVLFVLRAIDNGHHRLLVRTGDTDVLVIMVGHFKTFIEQYPALELWITMKTSSGVTM